MLPLLPEAEAELAEAADWYEGQRRGLGTELVEEVIRSLREAVPLAVVNEDHIVRRVLPRRFPYEVVLLEDPDYGSMIIAVKHHRRRPGSWKKRAKKANHMLEEPDER